MKINQLKSYGTGIVWMLLLFVIYQIASIPSTIMLYINNIGIWAEIVLIVIAILTAAVVLVIIGWFYHNRLRYDKQGYGLTRITRQKLIFIGIMIIIWVGFLFLENVYSQQFHIPQSDNQNIINEMTKKIPAWMFIDGVIFAPIVEELIFRGIFYTYFFKSDKKWVQWIGIIVNGALFGVIHDTGVNWIIYATMGSLLAFTYVKTKDIRYDIGLHMLNNLIAFI